MNEIEKCTYNVHKHTCHLYLKLQHIHQSCLSNIQFIHPVSLADVKWRVILILRQDLTKYNVQC